MPTEIQKQIERTVTNGHGYFPDLKYEEGDLTKGHIRFYLGCQDYVDAETQEEREEIAKKLKLSGNIIFWYDMLSAAEKPIASKKSQQTQVQQQPKQP